MTQKNHCVSGDYRKIDFHFINSKHILTSRLTKGQRKPPIEVNISGKSMVGFEGLLVHNNFWNFFGPEVSFENDLKIRF